MGSLLRMDLGRRCAVGLGALPLRTLGFYRRLLGVGAGAGGPAPAVFPRAGGVHGPQRRRVGAAQRRAARSVVGGAEWGRAGDPSVGSAAPQGPGLVGG